MLKEKLNDIRNEIELFIEDMKIKDPLMIFPSHLKKKAKWEKQNISDDIKKLRKSKQKCMRRNKYAGSRNN